MDKPWNWSGLSRNENITWDIVSENLDKRWNWYKLSKNENITWDIVKENPDKRWNWYGLSRNENITWDIVKNNPNKPWNCYGLSWNTFKYDRELYHKRQFVQENLLEEFVKYYMRPKRIIMMLETMGIDADQLDDYL